MSGITTQSSRRPSVQGEFHIQRYRLTVCAAMNALITKLACALSILLSSVHALHKSAGCGQDLLPGILQGGTGSSNNVSITSSAGEARSYALHVPVNYNKNDARGLIFSFHGRGETPKNQEELSKFSDAHINPDMLAVYPLGIKNEWQGDPDATTDDVQFTLDMLDAISSKYCIDLDRVYAAGKSNGGGFSANILACDPVASTKIAAFGGIAGAYYQGHNIDQCDGSTYPIACNPGRAPIPIFETHGTVDPVIQYNGGARRTRCLPSIPHFMTEWSKRNNFGSNNVSTTIADGKVVKYEYGADAGMPGYGVHYKISDLGHAWPDTVENPDGCCSYINGSQLLVEFFNKWDLNGARSGDVATGATTAIAATTPLSSQSSKVSSTMSSTLATLTSARKPSSGTSSGTSVSTTAGSNVQTTTTPSATTTGGGASSYPSPSCPAANGTVWTTPSQHEFSILCGYDTHGIPYTDPIYDLRNFGRCIEYCEADTQCGHVTYDGACYLKKAKTGGIYQHGNNISRVAIRIST